MDFRELGLGTMDLIDPAQDWGQWRALVKLVMNLQVLYRKMFLNI
jgi:hypothetical protein